MAHFYLKIAVILIKIIVYLGTDGQDGNGSRLEKSRLNFQVVSTCFQKIYICCCGLLSFYLRTELELSLEMLKGGDVYGISCLQLILG